MLAQSEKNHKSLCSSVGPTLIFSLGGCTQQRHSLHCLPRGDRDRMVHVAPSVTQPCTYRGSPQAFCGWGHKQALSLTPASCWVIASSDGKDSHGNGAAPSVFSHIPPQARVIITFLCKTPCKTGKLFSFFLNQRQAGFAMTTSAHLSLPTRQFPLQSDSECNKM